MKTRRTLLFLVLFALAALTLGTWWLRRDAPRTPPELDLSAGDAEVAELIESNRRAVLSDPRSGEKWGRLGMVFRAHGFGAEANKCFEEAERLDPREPRWPYYHGLTLVMTDPEKGSACLRRGIDRMDARDVAPRFRLAEVLIEQGKLEEAERLLGEANAAAPGHPRGALLAARIALARREPEMVLAALQGCWEDPHVQRQARLLAAEAWQRMSDADQAERVLIQANRLPPDQPWRDPFVEEVERLAVGVKLRLAEAAALSRAGQPREAVLLVERALERHPNEVGAWVLLGELHHQLGAPAEAERAFVRAGALDRNNVVAWFGLGVVRLGRSPREAATAFREAIRIKPDHTRAHYYLGVCLKERGDRAGARAAWREALRCQPDHEGARKALAELEGETNE